MESHDLRDRQSNTPAYAGQSAILPSTAPYPATSAADRYRQATLPTQLPPTSAPASRRSTASSYNYEYSGDGATQYVGQQMQTGTSTYAYSSESYRHPHQYQPYGLYGVSQQHQQQQSQQSTQQSPYESSMQSYQPRSGESAAIQALSSQFGAPTQNYYVGSSAVPTSVPAAAMGTPNVSTQYPGLSYTSQPSPLTRESLGSSFVPGMAETSHSSSAGAYGHQPQNQSTQGGPDVDQAYIRYQSILKSTFVLISDGQLDKAGQSLLDISAWLTSNVEALGLVRDDSNAHAERLKLWEDFNNCWLTTLQKQKDMTEEVLETGQPPRTSQALMERTFMEKLGQDLVHFCDEMEKHGLVDYQMGVWEEEIIAMLESCLDLVDELSKTQPSSSASHAVSASSSRRR